MNVGILGGGNISESHLKAALEIDGVEVSAVCGQNRQKVEALANICQATTYIDTAEFLKHRPMDLVAIGSPSGIHAEQGIAAAGAGLHVLVEKPIDISTERADQLISACARANRKLGIFFQDRVAPDSRRLKRMIDSGGLGDVLLATAHVKWYRPPDYYGDSRWRGTWELDGGGALMNQAIHTVDLLLWLLGDVRQVTALTRTQLHEIEVEDTAVAILDFESGALGTFEASTSAYPGQPRKLFVSGSEGTVSLEHDKIVAIDLHSAHETDSKPEATGRNLSESSPVVSDVTGHREIIRDFIEAIELDRPPLCDGFEARRSVELVEAIYRSAREGVPVALR
jgi:predicted dehydrogenase